MIRLSATTSGRSLRDELTTDPTPSRTRAGGLYWHLAGIRSAGDRSVTEAVSRAVAAHRDAAQPAMPLPAGRHRDVGTYVLSTWIFLRLLGLVFLAAFASLGVQID